jgi:DNA-binding response OmpR family regulator
LRLFVLDESHLLALTVERLAPPGTEVSGFTSFDEACREMLERAPDALVVAVNSAHLPWREFRALCAAHTPPVPVLCGSPLYDTAEEAGLDPARDASLFLHLPARVEEIAAAIAALLERAREMQRRSVSPDLAAARA